MLARTSRVLERPGGQQEFEPPMPLHRETRIVRYTAEQMYAVVAAIDRYPEFLPWCSKVVIRKREKKEDDVEFVTAEMVVSYLALQESYVSRVRLDYPGMIIEARHVEGPFKRLDSRWRFIPLPKGTEVHFLIDFAFSNPFLSVVANAAFSLVAAKMQQAFITRADGLYGDSRVASLNS
jgi:coenzyme Q-binding protein COQ10